MGKNPIICLSALNPSLSHYTLLLIYMAHEQYAQMPINKENLRVYSKNNTLKICFSRKLLIYLQKW